MEVYMGNNFKQPEPEHGYLVAHIDDDVKNVLFEYLKTINCPLTPVDQTYVDNNQNQIIFVSKTEPNSKQNQKDLATVLEKMNTRHQKESNRAILKDKYIDNFCNNMKAVSKTQQILINGMCNFMSTLKDDNRKVPYKNIKQSYFDTFNKHSEKCLAALNNFHIYDIFPQHGEYGSKKSKDDKFLLTIKPPVQLMESNMELGDNIFADPPKKSRKPIEIMPLRVEKNLRQQFLKSLVNENSYKNVFAKNNDMAKILHKFVEKNMKTINKGKELIIHKEIVSKKYKKNVKRLFHLEKALIKIKLAWSNDGLSKKYNEPFINPESKYLSYWFLSNKLEAYRAKLAQKCHYLYVNKIHINAAYDKLFNHILKETLKHEVQKIREKLIKYQRNFSILDTRTSDNDKIIRLYSSNACTLSNTFNVKQKDGELQFRKLIMMLYLNKKVFNDYGQILKPKECMQKLSAIKRSISEEKLSSAILSIKRNQIKKSSSIQYFHTNNSILLYDNENKRTQPDNLKLHTNSSTQEREEEKKQICDNTRKNDSDIHSQDKNCDDKLETNPNKSEAQILSKQKNMFTQCDKEDQEFYENSEIIFEKESDPQTTNITKHFQFTEINNIDDSNEKIKINNQDHSPVVEELSSPNNICSNSCNILENYLELNEVQMNNNPYHGELKTIESVNRNKNVTKNESKHIVKNFLEINKNNLKLKKPNRKQFKAADNALTNKHNINNEISTVKMKKQHFTVSKPTKTSILNVTKKKTAIESVHNSFDSPSRLIKPKSKNKTRSNSSRSRNSEIMKTNTNVDKVDSLKNKEIENFTKILDSTNICDEKPPQLVPSESYASNQDSPQIDEDVKYSGMVSSDFEVCIEKSKKVIKMDADGDKEMIVDVAKDQGDKDAKYFGITSSDLDVCIKKSEVIEMDENRDIIVDVVEESKDEMTSSDCNVCIKKSEVIGTNENREIIVDVATHKDQGSLTDVDDVNFDSVPSKNEIVIFNWEEEKDPTKIENYFENMCVSETKPVCMEQSLQDIQENEVPELLKDATGDRLCLAFEKDKQIDDTTRESFGANVKNICPLQFQKTATSSTSLPTRTLWSLYTKQDVPLQPKPKKKPHCSKTYKYETKEIVSGNKRTKVTYLVEQ